MVFFKGNKITQVEKHETISCTKIIEFDAGHRVFDADYKKCEKLHGHHYKVELTFSASSLNNGMIIDFCLIKERVKKWIDANWDHNVILSKRDSELAKAINEATGQKVFLLDNNATAELMANYLLKLCNQALFDDLDIAIMCIKVKLWETPTSFVECCVK